MSVSSSSPDDTEAELGLAERILDEASRLFAERGWAATSLREIAEAAGCTKPALYYHWGNKEALFLAALRRETGRLTEVIDASLANDESTLEDQLIQGLRALFETLERSPRGMALLKGAELRPDPHQPKFDFVGLRQRNQEAIRTLIAGGIARGEARDDVPLDDLVHGLTGLVDMRIQHWLQGAPLDSDLPERLVCLFLQGAGTP